LTRFAELIGQRLPSAVLRKAVRQDRINHAYLFAGPEGAGKLTAALAFAAALNCEAPEESGDSCGSCTSCRMMAGAGHPDVEVIPPLRADTTIKQMREMRRTAHYVPVRGKWKVVIIEQADTLNEDSSSCILKILEEPPPYLVIILLSRNPVLLLPTIRSRCLLVRFSNVQLEELGDALAERFGATEEQARFLAAYSEGRPGRAISLLGDESFFAWRRQMVELARQISSSDLRHALRLSSELQKLAPGDKEDESAQESEPAADVEPEDRPASSPKKGKRAAALVAIDALVLWYRDLLRLSIRGQDAELINNDLRDKLAACSPDPSRISAAIETLLWARRAIEGNANIQLTTDITLMRLMA